MTEAAALRRVLGLRLQAARNQLGGLVVRPPGTARSGSPRPLGSAAGVAFGLIALAVGFVFAGALADGATGFALVTGAVPRPQAWRAPGHRAAAEALAFLLLWALAWLVCVGIGYRNPLRLGARVESLLPLPVSLRAVFAAEILERALLNPLAWLTVFPLTTAVAWRWGHGAAAAAGIGFGLTAVHGVTVGCLEFALAVAIRRGLAPSSVGRVRALALGFAALSPMALQVVMMELLDARLAHRPGGLAVSLMAALGPLALESPAGLGLRLVQAGAPGLKDTAVSLAATVATWAAALAILRRTTIRGLDLLVARSERGRGPGRPWSPLDLLPAGPADELRALGRDLPALTVGVVVPILVLLLNVFLLRHEQTAGALAVIPLLVAGLFVGSACSSLARLGRSVWVLFTVPRALEAMALQRAVVFGGLGLAAGLLALAVLAADSGLPGAEARATLASLLVGVPALTIACGALGLLGARPLADEPSQRLDPDAMVHQVVLVAALASTAAMPDAAARARLLLFLLIVAGGLWQRARLHAPRLLDPATAPRPIDVADGMKGVVAFLMLQVLLAIGVREMPWARSQLAWAVAIVFALAGAMAIGLSVDPLVKQGLRLREIVPLWRPGAGPALAAAAVAGCATFAVALGYLAILQQQLGFALPPEWAPRALARALEHPVLRFVIVCALAPVVEEILFRGLLFVGLREALGERLAILASAALFASIHSEFAFGGVFALGAACAWAYQRTGLLSAAMVVHAVHNGLAVTVPVG